METKVFQIAVSKMALKKPIVPKIKKRLNSKGSTEN
jgi:hypothetical protein